ncbi:MAG TPA: VOC family protein [Sphingomicrobium sp.]|nr:VOC family protein [Sphingomicrobium sp.]
MTVRTGAKVALALALSIMAAGAADAQAGRITGLGGVFIKSKDPKALAGWYRDVLGIKLESWGGAMLRYDAPGHPSEVVWTAFPTRSGYFAPSAREVMLNFAVDDLDAFLTRIEAKGVKVIKRDDTDPNGRFAWIMDPDGTKIELRQVPHK